MPLLKAAFGLLNTIDPVSVDSLAARLMAGAVIYRAKAKQGPAVHS